MSGSRWDVAAAVRDLEGECDVTLTVSRDDAAEHLLVAVSGSDAFLGLDAPDGLLQYVPQASRGGGTRRFTIGGQKTEIASRYVVDVESAARVVLEWLQQDRTGPFPESWQHQ